MKLLVIPDTQSTFHFVSKLTGVARLKAEVSRIRFRHNTYESLYYSKLSEHAEDCYFLGGFHSEYTRPVRTRASNPSAFNYTNVKTINEQGALSALSSFDALLISYESLQHYEHIVNAFRRAGRLVAVLDHKEDEALFETKDPTLVFRGLCESMFDIYFKNHLPLGMKTKKVYPIAPTPINEGNFDLSTIPFKERQYNIFFSGIVDKRDTNINRSQLIEALSGYARSNFRVVDVADHYKQRLPSNSEYLGNIKNAKMCFSPAGRAWMTTRHVILATGMAVPIIPICDCETVDFSQTDLGNSICFRMINNLSHREVRDEVHTLKNKIDSVIDDDVKLESIASSWRQQVFSKHTTSARCRYIIDTIRTCL